MQLLKEIFEDQKGSAYAVLQLPLESDAKFQDFESVRDGLDLEEYDVAFQDELEEIMDKTEILEKLVEEINLNHRSEYEGHGLEISDIVLIKDRNEVTGHYKNPIGFMEIPLKSFLKEDAVKAAPAKQRKEKEEPMPKSVKKESAAKEETGKKTKPQKKDEKVSLLDDTREIKTYGKHTMSWTTAQMSRAIDNGTAVFDNPVQRTMVWDTERKSLLIHSMLIGAPIPPLYANKTSDASGKEHKNVYDIIDGKQRCYTVRDFINNQFALAAQTPPLFTLDGERIEIAGRTFEELSPVMQEDIKGYAFTVFTMEDLSGYDFAEIFSRINNGKPLSAIEITRVKTKDFEKVKELSKHPFFQRVFTARSIEKYAAEDFVIKALAMLKMDKPCLDTKYIRIFAKNETITNADVKRINTALDKAEKIYSLILENKSKVEAKKFLKKTNLLSWLKVLDSDASAEALAEAIGVFLLPKDAKEMSISVSYNEASKSGVGHIDKVEARDKAVTSFWQRYSATNRM